MALTSKRIYGIIFNSKNIGNVFLVLLGLFFLHLIQLEAVNFLNGTKEGVDGETPEEKLAREESERIAAEEKKKADDMALYEEQTKKIDTNSKENERLHKEAEDEEPMELKEEDLVKPIVISP
jgi:hypothetical protein